MSKIPHVVILGGGFGGLSAANEIRNSLDSSKVNITIIDKKDWFMVGYAKLWIMNGSRTFENSIGSLNELPKKQINFCLLYTSPSPRDPKTSRMPSSA